MRVSKVVATLGLTAIACFAQAQSIEEGVVLEGEMLPIGLSIGDSRADVEQTIANFIEFTDGEGICYGRTDYNCVYTAVDGFGAEIGKVVVFYKDAASSPDDVVRSLQWTFPKWTTSAGVSIEALSQINSLAELEAFYPENGYATIQQYGSYKYSLVKSDAAGVGVSYSRNYGNFESGYGWISAPE